MSTDRDQLFTRHDAIADALMQYSCEADFANPMYEATALLAAYRERLHDLETNDITIAVQQLAQVTDQRDALLVERSALLVGREMLIKEREKLHRATADALRCGATAERAIEQISEIAGEEPLDDQIQRVLKRLCQLETDHPTNSVGSVAHDAIRVIKDLVENLAVKEVADEV